MVRLLSGFRNLQVLVHFLATVQWALTDCISFVVMEERELTLAATGDRHFRQAGFTPLLGSD